MKLATALIVLTTFCNVYYVDGRVAVSAPPVAVLDIPSAGQASGKSTSDVANWAANYVINANEAQKESANVDGELYVPQEIPAVSLNAMLNGVLPYFWQIVTGLQEAQSMERITEYVRTRTILRQTSAFSKYAVDGDKEQPRGRSPRAITDVFEQYWPMIEYVVETALGTPNGTKNYSLSDIPRYAVNLLLGLPLDLMSSVNGSMLNATQKGMSVVWNLISSTLIPWLDTWLLWLADAGFLPSNMTIIIRELHSAYRLLQLLGYLR